MRLIEVQVDRLVGATHHFGGLGVGNIASVEHAGEVSNPAAAALQGLDKMRWIAGLGVPQVILPPQKRPDIEFLRALGFAGDRDEVLGDAGEQAPTLLSAAMSCSAMWTANAATVTPATDSGGRLTMTIANLEGSLHRAIEPDQTRLDLQRVFANVAQIQRPLPGGAAMRDEGAANHMRLGASENQPGIHVWVYGDGSPEPQRYWPRQTLAACQAVARRHALDPANVFFLKQHPRAIDAGAFHNDVVAASHHGLLLHHQHAFHDAQDQLELIAERYRSLHGREMVRVEVDEAELSIEETVRTYLFNSQIISAGDRSQAPILVCPVQVASSLAARRIVDQWCERLGLFSQLHFVDLNQSMSGGGGPACLRLRVPIAEDQLDQLPGDMQWSVQLDSDLRDLILTHYPTAVTLADLARESFVQAAEHAESLVRARILQSDEGRSGK